MYGSRPRSALLFPVLSPLLLSRFSQYTTLLRSWKQMPSRRSKICNSSPPRIMKAHRGMTPWGYGVGLILLASWVKDGRALVWCRHDIPIMATQAVEEQVGTLFGREYEILGLN